MKKRFSVTFLVVCVSAVLLNTQAQQRSTISGSVYREHFGDALIPVADASVYLETPAPTGGILPVFLVVDSVKTDNLGRYTFDSVYTASYRLTFIAKGYDIKQLQAYITKDTTIFTYLVPLTRYYTLTGKVTLDCPACKSALPQLIPGCTVTVTIPYRVPYSYLAKQSIAIPVMPIIQFSYRGVTGNDGVYRIDSIPAYSMTTDSSWVTAVKSGYYPETAKKLLRANLTDTLDFALVTNLTGVLKPAEQVIKGKQVLTFCKSTGILRIEIGKSQAVAIDAYHLDGRFICTLLKKTNLKSGAYSFNLGSELTSKGVMLLRAIGESFNEAVIIVQ